MTADSTPVAPDALHRELRQERIQSARRINLLRFCGVSAFFALFLVLGGILGLPAWTGNLKLFTAYWIISAAVFWASRCLPRVAPFTTLAVALLDVPAAFEVVLHHPRLEKPFDPQGLRTFVRTLV